MKGVFGSRLREAVLGWIFPQVCQLCEESEACQEDGYVCLKCQARVQWIKGPCCQRCGLPFETGGTETFECSNCRDLLLPFQTARSVLTATGVCLDLIHRYKYQRALWFEPLLARWLCAAATPVLSTQSWDAIVPVPLHPLKQREREFNQSARLAQHLSQATGIPLATTWVRRQKSTDTQTSLTRKQRNLNVRRAFIADKSIPTSIKRVILFDDVFTTGATASACSSILLHGGVEEIGVWTLARGV